MARVRMAAAAGVPTAMTAVVQVLAFIAIALDGIDMKFGSIDMNTERLLLPVIVMVLFVRIMAERKISFPNATNFYALWVVTVVCSALLTGDLGAHMSGLLISIAPFFYFLLFTQKGLSREGLARVLERFLWAISISSILIYAIWWGTGRFSFMIDRDRIQLTMTEPNILGAFIASLMMVHLAFFKWGTRHLTLHIVCATALALTASKAPYIAYALALVFYLFRSGALRKANALLLTWLIVFGLPLAGIVFSGSFADFYYTMLDRPDAIRNRMFALNIGWERFLERPILGNGPLDFSLYNNSILSAMGTENTRNMWIWQIWVALLHDEGVVGFTFFVAFIIASWKRGGRMVRRGNPEFIAIQAGALAVIISSQVTTTHLAAMFGVTFGLLNAPAFRWTSRLPTGSRPADHPQPQWRSTAPLGAARMQAR